MVEASDLVVLLLSCCSVVLGKVVTVGSEADAVVASGLDSCVVMPEVEGSTFSVVVISSLWLVVVSGKCCVDEVPAVVVSVAETDTVGEDDSAACVVVKSFSLAVVSGASVSFAVVVVVDSLAVNASEL